MKNINERNNFVFEFRPVTELFEEQVKLHPEKYAVVSGKESFTYAQLNERANRIANALVEKGVRRETIVGVVLERCCFARPLLSVYAPHQQTSPKYLQKPLDFQNKQR